ncbi:transporter substrate-binding domain-containing protein [Bradyrhizobium sp. 15]|uniref:transporter substrate-binding domain-containing protein n=1 Tax=Bradyrhizobium sp. 15 TaxID=2782633 RepID=UPI001FF84179|nr:transporter substrate-binding domain-containing protein [Bradyrhizobium sp. 15]MCK1440581.1 transporter substrate-binding domain-containing protein [Bradyrhizobium sp. 15]
MSRKEIGLLACTVVIAAALLTSPTVAAGPKTVLRSATITYYPPFSYKDEKTDKLTGFDHELAEAMAAEIGATIEWEEFTYAQILSLAPLKTGRVHFYGTAVSDRPDKREKGISFIDYVYEPFVFFTLRENSGKYPDPMALCGESVAATRGDPTQAQRVQDWSDRNCIPNSKPPIKVATGENSAQNMLLLKQGRVAGAVNGAGSLAVANSVDGNRYLVIGEPLNKTMYGMGFLSKDREIGEKLRGGLQHLIDDGSYDALLEKWGLAEAIFSIGSKATIDAGVK